MERRDRKWSKDEKGVKEGPVAPPPILDPRFGATRGWRKFRMKGECEGERGECEGEREGEW